MKTTYQELETTMEEKLINLGIESDIARRCSVNLAESTLEGVPSHGINRFPRLVSMIKNGTVKPHEKAKCIESHHAFEIWDGNLGIGIINAEDAMSRAVELSKGFGIGCVSMRNTNHWMRGGAFGIQAAKNGCVGICWTTTNPNMPAWGAKDQRIGNNPLVMCVPYKDSFVLVDAAMAQFSYGAIDNAINDGKCLPVPGGYDEEGKLTSNPCEINKTKRVLPIGFWKGSSFSILMEMIVTCLSLGKPICQIAKQGGKATDEYNLSQIFIAINVEHSSESNELIQQIKAFIKSSEPAEGVNEIFIPGELLSQRKKKNQEQGIEVNDKVWAEIQAI